MTYLQFRNHFDFFKIFSVHDIKKVFPDFDTRRLVEWQKKNYIRKIINKWYLFAHHSRDEQLSYFIANRMYSPSYISLESALSYYSVIPEGVYTITSITSKKTAIFETDMGRFWYRHMKENLLFGYDLMEWEGRSIKIAGLEKAVLDYLYLNHHVQKKEDFSDLRWNAIVLREEVNQKKLMEYLTIFQNKTLEKRVQLLSEYLS